MGERPDVERDHQRRRPALLGQSRADRLGARAQHGEGALAELLQLGIVVERNPRLEHRRVIGRLLAGEGEIGLAQAQERRHRIRQALAPGMLQPRLEALEAALGHIGHELVAVAEMPVGRGLADTRRARRLGEGEAQRPLRRDQLERRRDQRFAEIAVVIVPAPRAAPVSPAHVRSSYINRGCGAASMFRAGIFRDAPGSPCGCARRRSPSRRASAGGRAGASDTRGSRHGR